MKLNRLLCVQSAITLFLGQQAVAADAEPSTAPTGVYDGFYTGVHGGLGAFASSFRSTPDIVESGKEYRSGGAIGGHAGYGISFGRVYLGVDGEIQDFVSGEAKDVRSDEARLSTGAGTTVGGLAGACVAAPCPGPLTNVSVIARFTERYEHSLGANGALRARVGYDLGGLMPFAALGVAAGQVETSYQARADVTTVRSNSFGSFTTEDASEASAGDRDVLFGYTVGGGVQVALPAGFSLRGEYAFTDLGEKRYEFEFDDGSTSSAVFETQTHQGRLGLSYHF